MTAKEILIMNNYFRITTYNPATDVSAILDSNGRFEKLWQFSSYLIHKGYHVLYVHSAEEFDEGNLPRIQEPSDKIIVRACDKGKPVWKKPYIIVHTKKYSPDKPDILPSI